MDYQNDMFGEYDDAMLANLAEFAEAEYYENVRDFKKKNQNYHFLF